MGAGPASSKLLQTSQRAEPSFFGMRGFPPRSSCEKALNPHKGLRLSVRRRLVGPVSLSPQWKRPFTRFYGIHARKCVNPKVAAAKLP